MWNNSEQEQNTIPKCSFCGKSQDQVHQLIAGPGDKYICNECVALYREHIENEVGESISIEKIMKVCSTCGTRPPASHRYCYNCGSPFAQET